jgi:hypothetical protein
LNKLNLDAIRIMLEGAIAVVAGSFVAQASWCLIMLSLVVSHLECCIASINRFLLQICCANRNPT